MAMAVLSELVQAIALCEGIDQERVAAIARAVREAGLIATHGRGTSAARMTAKDAANLLIAANTAETARSAPEAVRRFRALEAKGIEFGRVLEEMIDAAARRRLAEYLLELGFGPARNLRDQFGPTLRQFAMRIEFIQGRPAAVIECRIPSTAMPKFLAFYPARQDREKDRRTTITHKTILAVGHTIGAA
jgi:hypothetical protein